MNPIKLLDNSTINKIAAGEVVERPSSVIKELVENSIDANASAVTIEIREGGTTFMKVLDNGTGIPKDQAVTAFVRHATNKIVSTEDLESILSLGFRGEALASIAAVSQVEMFTKTREDAIGTYIEIYGGKVMQNHDAGCTEGTAITVKNLFYNVPARRKFLKKPSTESGYISDMVNRFALGHPEISFKYSNNSTVLLHTSGNNDLKTAVLHVYGKDIALKMLSLSEKDKQYQLSGLIGRPELARANRTYENLFINGRFIKSELISSAVEDAYKTRLIIGKFPVYVLNFEMPPTLVDVNVHPTKLEVRFAEEETVYQFVYQAVLKVLKENILIPESNWDAKPTPAVKELMQAEQETLFSTGYETNKPEKKEKDIEPDLTEIPDTRQEPLIQEIPAAPKKEAASNIQNGNEQHAERSSHAIAEEALKFYTGSNLKKKEGNTTSPTIEALMNQNKKEKKPLVLEEKRPEEEEETVAENQKKENASQARLPFFNNYRIIGQLFQTYWVIEQGNSLFMVDQHAAHERILFEELKEKFKNKTVISQRLLSPIPLTLTEAEKNTVKSHLPLLSDFGFELEELGQNTYGLKGVPYVFQEPMGANSFLEMVDMLGENTISNMYDTKIHTIATMACKAAVKGNDKLSFQEAKALIERLLSIENPFTCPHGRPTIIEMSKYELEKKFKRIQ